MQNLLQYLEKDEEIILNEKDTKFNVVYEIIWYLSFLLFILIFNLLFSDVIGDGFTPNIFYKITDILMIPLFIYMIFVLIKSFNTKMYLTNKSIIAAVFGKVQKYPFEKVCQITATKGNWLSLTVKNGEKTEKLLSKINAKIFIEKFLSIYPDYKEEKRKTSPFVIIFCIIFTAVLFLSVTQAEITDKKETVNIVNEYSAAIHEKECYEWFSEIFSNFLYNLELQKSDKRLKVIVSFVADENSALQKADIVLYSDNQDFNDKAIRAVEKSFPTNTEMPKTLKQYVPIKMRINVVHNGTDNEDLMKNYTIWFEIFGPKQTKPYAQLYLK